MMPFAFMPKLGTTELLVIAFVSLLIFSNRLLAVMRTLRSFTNRF
ncbi:MAG: twin-arginine translocase TatA/TatE family subunit [Isosphaeraceae bacterium]